MAVAQILGEIQRLITALEATQSLLLELFARKHIALVEANAEELLRLAEAEALLAKQLAEHVQRRHQVLSAAQVAGLPSSGISELARAIVGGNAPEFLARIRHCQQIAARLRRESWVHWVVAQRSYTQHGQLLDLIAHSGERSPTYESGVGNTSNHQGQGGVLFDASA